MFTASVAGSLVLKTNIGAKNAVFDLVSTRSPHVRVVKNAWWLPITGLRLPGLSSSLPVLSLYANDTSAV